MAEEPQQTIIPATAPASEKGEKQTAASPDVALELIESNKSKSGLEQYPMTEAVQLVSETGGFRNQGVKILFSALCQLRETDLNDARIERKLAQNEASLLRDNYHSEQTKRAVLEERLRCEVPLKRMQNIFISLGGILVGSCLQPLVTAFTVGYFLLSVVGLGMMAIGWFYEGNSRKEQP